MPKSLWYTGAPLDRLSHRRTDANWLAERLANADTLLVPVWRNQNLSHQEDDRALLPTIGEARELLDAGKHISLLGIRYGQAYFAIDLSHHDDPYQHPLLQAQGAFEDLRKFGWRIFHNTVTGGFQGRIVPVNPKRESLLGLPCVPLV